jgi:NADH-quinone oxidoreductase subunit E
MSLLSTDAQRRIDRQLAKYPAEQKRSAVIAALAIAQDEHGWLSAELMDEVAGYLGMPTVAVYEVASFYSMFELKPTGRYKLTICTNLPCALQGATAAAEHLQRRLGIGFGETTGDGRFTLKEGECFGACGDAPVLLVNNKRMVSFMNPPQLDALIDELSGDAVKTAGGEGPPRASSSVPSGGSEGTKPQRWGDNTP